MQQLTNPPSTNDPAKVNENFECVGIASVFGKRHEACTGLVWAWQSGIWGGLSIAAGTVTLAANATNYLVADRSTGAVTASTATTNWNNPAAYARLHKITTGSALVSAWEDHRGGPLGAMGELPPPTAVTVASASTIALPLGQRVAKISGTTTITTITATGHSGAVVTLIFESTAGVTAGSNLKLSASLSATADDTLTLACDGTNWHEVARSAN